MSARRIDMHRLQELVRLHRRDRSARAIARQLKMGRDTVRAYMKALAAASLLSGSPDALPDVSALKAAIASHVPREDEPR